MHLTFGTMPARAATSKAGALSGAPHDPFTAVVVVVASAVVVVGAAVAVVRAAAVVSKASAAVVEEDESAADATAVAVVSALPAWTVSFV